MIKVDELFGMDRIVTVFDEKAGWLFGGEEHRGAPEEVQRCIDEHEGITFRAYDPTGPNRHEFRAMVEHLQTRLNLEVFSDAEVDASVEAVPKVSSLRDTLAAQKRETEILRQQHAQEMAKQAEKLSAKDEELAASAAEIARLRGRLRRLRSVSYADLSQVA